MDTVKLLDCTLREAPIDGLMWGTSNIKKMIQGLEKSNIDIIEVGFLKNDDHKDGTTIFRTVSEIKKSLEHKNTTTMYVALVDYGRYDIANLEPYDGTSIDAIRICFKHDEIDDVLGYADAIRKKGYQVCIQHVDTMGYTDEEICCFIEKINEFKPYAYSIVDTFGAMYSEDLLHYIELVNNKLEKSIWMGFHGHNNLMLADANAQLFVNKLSKKHNIIVDTSLYGCGRGAGNAHTELLMQYLVEKNNANYDLDEVLDLIDTVIVMAEEQADWGYTIPYFISGIYNAHTFNVRHLLKRHNIKSRDLREIIEKLDDTQKKKYDYKLLEKLYIDHFEHEFVDDESIQYIRGKLEERNVVLLAPGKSVQECCDDVSSYIRKNRSIVIGVNNLIEGYRQDFVFYSSSLRYQNLQYLDLQGTEAPELIITSNIKSEPDENEVLVDYKALIKYGWVNLDSSIILLLRLLVKCGVKNINIAGLDGFRTAGFSFYRSDLDTGVKEADKIELTEDNYSMIEDFKNEYPEIQISFLTPTIYEKIYL